MVNGGFDGVYPERSRRAVIERSRNATTLCTRWFRLRSTTLCTRWFRLRSTTLCTRWFRRSLSVRAVEGLNHLTTRSIFLIFINRIGAEDKGLKPLVYTTTSKWNARATHFNLIIKATLGNLY